MALEEDLVAGTAIIAAAEEVVEPDLVQARRAGIGRKMSADPLEPMVGTQHHRQRVPADHAPDAQLHRLVAGEFRLLLRADRVQAASPCRRSRVSALKDASLPSSIAARPMGSPLR